MVPEQPVWAGSWDAVITPQSAGVFSVDPQPCDLDLRLGRDGHVYGQVRSVNEHGAWLVDLEGTEEWQPGRRFTLELAGRTFSDVPQMHDHPMIATLGWLFTEPPLFGGSIGLAGYGTAAIDVVVD